MRRILHTAALAATAAFVTPASAATLAGHTSNIFGAAIAAVPYEVRDESGVLMSAPGSVTSATGDFSLNVPVGRYDVTFTPPISAHVFGATRNGVRVDVSTTLNVQLAPGQLLTGRIVTPAGGAVAHVALQFADPVSLVAPANTANAVTDEAGNVNVLVSPGTWRVSGEPRLDQGIAPRILGTFDLNTDQSLGTTTMLPGFLVTGRILDPLGGPLSAAEFYAHDRATGAELYTPTDATDALGVARFVIPAGTYDIFGVPPLGPVYASRALRHVVVGAATDLGDVTLAPGVAVSARCLTPAGAAVASVECRVDSLPAGGGLAIVNPLSDAAGALAVVMTPGALRLSFVPPLASRRLPQQWSGVIGSTGAALGDIVLAAGHWLDLSVLDASTGQPVPGARFELLRTDGTRLPTAVRLTDAAGSARITVDTQRYHLRVLAPDGAWNDTHVLGLASRNDTSVTVMLTHPGLSAGHRMGRGLVVSPPWPNPAYDEARLSVSVGAERTLRVSVWDVTGRCVWRSPLPVVSGQTTWVWNGRDNAGRRVPAGSYWWRVEDGRVMASRHQLMLTH